MQEKNTHPTVMKFLDWAYEKAIAGLPGMDTASQLAEKYMLTGGSLNDQAKALIRWQNAKAGTSGFVTGLGGFMTLPVAIPANMASVLYIQMRMIAAIAHMGGYDLRDNKVKTLVYVCLVGNFAKDLVQEAGIRIGTRLTAKAVQNISENVLLTINAKIGFKLLTTGSSKGIINLSKAVPVAGGVVSGAIDTVATSIIGHTARKMFLSENHSETGIVK